MYIDSITWEQYWKYLLVERKVKDTAKNKDAYHSHFNKVQKAFRGKEFTRTTVNDFFYNLQISDARESYMNKFITMLQHVDSILQVNVMKGFTRYKEVFNEPFTMSPEEIERLLQVKLPYVRLRIERQLRDFIVLQFLFATGCRADELQKLEWKDLFSSPEYYVIFRDTKSRKNRKVAITKWMYDQLIKLPHYSDRIFDSVNGKMFNTQEFNLNLKKMAIIAELPLELQQKITIHKFRSSRATYLAKFVDPFLLTKILGHESTEVTMKYYHADLQQMVNAAYNNPLQVQEAPSITMVNVVKEHLTKLYNRQKFTVNITEVGRKGGFTLKVDPIGK
jgi:integrase